jgi:hypothetical protein
MQTIGKKGQASLLQRPRLTTGPAAPARLTETLRNPIRSLHQKSRELRATHPANCR